MNPDSHRALVAATADAPSPCCRNCSAPVKGKFCSACGESTTVHVPSAGEFLHEFIGHFIALEGKLWKTLLLLVLRPGQLTLEYLRGRRVPFIAPLRLYLTLSVVFFALIKFYGVDLLQITLNDKAFGVSYAHVVPDQSKPGTANTLTFSARVTDGEHDVTASERIRATTGALGRVNQKWMNNLKEFMAEPEKKRSEMLNHGFLAYLPYILIATLPIFALWLKLIYRRSGRHYGEHLVFAMHSNSLAFLIASLMIVVPGSVLWLAIAVYAHGFSIISAWDYMQCLPFVFLLAYLPLAMHRAYGGSWLATILRWLLLMTAHLAIVVTSTIVAETIAIVGHS